MESLLATYQIHAATGDIERRAEVLALEQTVELPRSAVRDRFVKEQIVAQVQSIRPAGAERFQVIIRYPLATTALDPAQLLNVLFGNTSLQSDVILLDVEFPSTLLSVFPGPQFGIAGLRKRTGAYQRPLTSTALKPMGLSIEALASLCHTFALAGIDIIKDDHGLADHEFAPFEDRVGACMIAIERVYQETGHRAVYVPNLIGTPETIRRQVNIAQQFGVRAVMVAPMLIGLPAFYELVKTQLQMPVLAHPAFGGALRIAPELLFGTIFRLFGADAVIYPHYGGRFSYSESVCVDIAHRLRRPWAHLQSAMPIPAGGMPVNQVDELIRFYGSEIVLLIGGSLYEAGPALLERSRDFVIRVRQSTKEVNIVER
jgi:ribulose-bisphosphate carboxylase large chain